MNESLLSALLTVTKLGGTLHLKAPGLSSEPPDTAMRSWGKSLRPALGGRAVSPSLQPLALGQSPSAIALCPAVLCQSTELHPLLRITAARNYVG